MRFPQSDGCYGTELSRVRAMTPPRQPPFIEPWTMKALEREVREARGRRCKFSKPKD